MNLTISPAKYLDIKNSLKKRSSFEHLRFLYLEKISNIHFSKFDQFEEKKNSFERTLVKNKKISEKSIPCLFHHSRISLEKRNSNILIFSNLRFSFLETRKKEKNEKYRTVRGADRMNWNGSLREIIEKFLRRGRKK